MPKESPLIHATDWYVQLLRCEKDLRQRVKSQGAPSYHDKYIKEALVRLLELDGAHGLEPQILNLNAGERQLLYSAVEAVEECISQMDGKRLVSHASRFLNGRKEVLYPNTEDHQGKGKVMSWKGLPLIKAAFDFSILTALLANEKPRTVFEIGSGSGASALFMADTLLAHEVDAHVYSVDIKPVKERHKRVTFIQGDATAPDQVFSREVLEKAPHPWLVVDDAHSTAYHMLHFLYDFTKVGDYIFIEDSRAQQKVLGRFLMEVDNTFLVDTHYTDFFGRNCTSAVNSILVRTR